MGWLEKKGSESYSSRRGGGGYMAIRIGHESVCLSLKVWVRSISSSMGRRGCWPSWWSRKMNIEQESKVMKTGEKRLFFLFLGVGDDDESGGVDMGRWAHALLPSAHGWLDRAVDGKGEKMLFFIRLPKKRRKELMDRWWSLRRPLRTRLSDRRSATTPLGNPPSPAAAAVVVSLYASIPRRTFLLLLSIYRPILLANSSRSPAVEPLPLYMGSPTTRNETNRSE